MLATKSSAKSITKCAIVMALYIVTMYFTQSFAFREYQIRIATALYVLAALDPILILPLALSNCLSNYLFGGLGILDIVGGFCAGLITCVFVWIIAKTKLKFLVSLPVLTFPTLIIPAFIGSILNIPYWTFVMSLAVGQAICAIVGYVLYISLKKALYDGK